MGLHLYRHFHSSVIPFHDYATVNCLWLCTWRNELLDKDNSENSNAERVTEVQAAVGLVQFWMTKGLFCRQGSWRRNSISGVQERLIVKGTELRWRESTTHSAEPDFSQSTPRQEAPLWFLWQITAGFPSLTGKHSTPPGLTCANQTHRRISEMEPLHWLGSWNEPSWGWDGTRGPKHAR